MKTDEMTIEEALQIIDRGEATIRHLTGRVKALEDTLKSVEEKAIKHRDVAIRLNRHDDREWLTVILSPAAFFSYPHDQRNHIVKTEVVRAYQSIIMRACPNEVLSELLRTSKDSL